MPLTALAAAIERAPSDGRVETKLRARFTNLLRGYENGHIEAAAVERRLDEMVRSFNRHPADTLDAVLAACDDACDAFKEQDHYERPQPLLAYLDTRAVTIQRNQGGRLGQVLLGYRASAGEIVDAFDGGSFIPNAMIGAPDKPLWLTPYIDDIEEFCEEANYDLLPPRRRATILRWIVGNLGLADCDPKDEILAFVTAKQVANLTFEHPNTRAKGLKPAGSTAIEARRHPRFRWWPPESNPDGQGRTYALDADERTLGGPIGNYGLPELLCPRLAADAFAACIYIGTVGSIFFDDPDQTYLEEIGGDHLSSSGLLRDLHVRFGL